MSASAGADTERGEHSSRLHSSVPAGGCLRLDVRAWQVVAIAGLGVFALHTGLGVGGPGADTFVEIWVYFGLEALAVGAIAGPGRSSCRSERAAWAWLGCGPPRLQPRRPRPDVRLQRQRPGSVARRPALSVLLPGRCTSRCSFSSAPGTRISTAASGSTVSALPWRSAPSARPSCSRWRSTTPRATACVATNLAYPLGDVVLFALVAGVFWLAGLGAGLEWVVIGLACSPRRGGRHLPVDRPRSARTRRERCSTSCGR